VIPESIEFETRDITDQSVTLNWSLETTSYRLGGCLQYEVEVQPKNMTPFVIEYDIDRDVYMDNLRNCTMDPSLTFQLPYPYYEYKLRVKAKLRTSRTDVDMWSKSVEKTIKTLARRPDRPPETAISCFHIDYLTQNVRLYWRNLQDFELNGPNFNYEIQLNDNVLDTR